MSYAKLTLFVLYRSLIKEVPCVCTKYQLKFGRIPTPAFKNYIEITSVVSSCIEEFISFV